MISKFFKIERERRTMDTRSDALGLTS